MKLFLSLLAIFDTGRRNVLVDLVFRFPSVHPFTWNEMKSETTCLTWIRHKKQAEGYKISSTSSTLTFTFSLSEIAPSSFRTFVELFPNQSRVSNIVQYPVSLTVSFLFRANSFKMAGGKKLTKEDEILLQNFSRNVSTKSSALFYANSFIISAIPLCT